MIRYVWLISAVTIVFCLISGSKARSATSSSYQHPNGISVTASQAKLEEAQSSSSSAVSSPIWKDLSLVYRIYQQCASENLSVCLKVKLLTGLEKALRTAKTLNIIEGVQFVKSGDDNGGPGNAKNHAQSKSTVVISEKDIEAVLPRGLDAKEQILNSMIFKKLTGFLQDHTLQVKFPDLRSADHLSDNSVESRKKKDKKGGGAYIMIPLLLGGTFVPIAYGALAMLAGKALIVSKLALVLASIIGIKKLLSGGGGKESSHEVVVQSGGHSGWGRDFDLAYSGWKPAKETVPNM